MSKVEYEIVANRKIVVNKDTNSIDQKAKQFAEFFNGEVINLE